MNIQIFGKSKCFDTKKAERYFKERKIKFQQIDLIGKGMSPGELRSVVSAVGLNDLVDEKAPGAEIVKFLAFEKDKEEKLLENPSFIKTPVVRNGRQATTGYAPDIWKTWV